MKNSLKSVSLLLSVFLLFFACGCYENRENSLLSDGVQKADSKPYVMLNGGIPQFSDSDKTTVSFERYSELDALGRCKTAYACIGRDIMPTEKRGSIGQVRPSGWHTVKYDFIDGKYLYNRCHLIGYQLSGENANERNLITGTRYLNVEGMLPFENMVADYVKETGNHVLYRVTPVFENSELVARGVTIEALSVEDGGDGICFNVYVYNIQPGVIIDYSNGTSKAESENSGGKVQTSAAADYILNTSSKKFHKPDCSGTAKISEKNRQNFHGTRDELINSGYSPCKNCNP